MGKMGTVSVMFTDIVGSTSLMESEGSDAWDDHRRAHFNVVRAALATHSGTEVKNTGDGVMGVFASVRQVAIADTDWGSLMVHPGDPELGKRLKNVFENGPWAEPFAGRKLHGAMQVAGFVDVVSVPFFVRAEPGLMTALAGVIQRLTKTGIAGENEMRDFSVALEAALNDGSGLWAFTSFAAVGTRPTD